MIELERTITDLETAKTKACAAELETKTELDKLKLNNIDLLRTSDQLDAAVAKGKITQDALINFVSELINSNKIMDLSAKVNNIEVKIKTEEEKIFNYAEIEEEIRELKSIVKYFDEMLSKAESLIKDNQSIESFNEIIKTIEAQRNLLKDSTQVIEKLTEQVSILQKQLNMNQEREIAGLRKQVEDTNRLNKELSKAQKKLTESKDQIIKEKDQRIKEISSTISERERKLENELNKAYQNNYNEFFELIQKQLAKFHSDQQKYADDRGLFLNKGGDPQLLSDYEAIQFTMPDRVTNISKYNLEVSRNNLKSLQVSIDTQQLKIDKAKQILIQETVNHDSKLELEKKLRDEHASYQQKLNEQQAEQDTVLKSKTKKIKDQLKNQNTEKQREFENKFESFYRVIKKFDKDFLYKRGISQGGIKHAELRQLLGQITECYEYKTDADKMRELFIKFCALCMQKGDYFHSFFMQTTTGKNFFEAIIKNPESINAINKAIGTEGNGIVAMHKSDKGAMNKSRYRYRDFAIHISGLLSEGSGLSVFSEKDVTAHYYMEKRNMKRK
jgi:DNA repair exonuclease SbcCD ATPase subunit